MVLKMAIRALKVKHRFLPLRQMYLFFLLMPELADKIPLDAVSAAIYLIGGLLGRTWRPTLAGRTDLEPFNDRGQGRIYAFWHSNLLPLCYIFRNTGKVAVVSESRDGRRAAAVAQRWGHGIIHGSSSHGGAFALRVCVRELREGRNIVITPDGPRGPAETAKSGVAQIALVSGAAVVPLLVKPKSAWRLRSWDRFIIPMPFTPITVFLGDPIHPQTSVLEKDPAAHLTARIQKALAP